MRLDRDAALTFEIHRIEELILFIAFVDRAGALEQSIRERRFPVIDMRDDAEIPGQLDRHKALHYAGASSVGQSTGRRSCEREFQISDCRFQISVSAPLDSEDPEQSAICNYR